MSTPAPHIIGDPILLRADDGGGVTTLTLNRPNRYNALTVELLTELEACLHQIGQDRSVRVVVLAGSGKAFCAGCDLKQMRAKPEKAFQQALFKQCSRVMLGLQQLPQVVIARVHGIAAAMGCALVARCDLAVASTAAGFAVNGVNQGLFCTSPGVAVSRNVSPKRAFDMLFTGRLIDADTAVDWGLINKAVAPERLDDTVNEYARNIAQKLPLAIRTGKAMFYRQLNMDLPDAFEYAGELMACDMMDTDVMEGIDAFIEKRDPAWKKDLP